MTAPATENNVDVLHTYRPATAEAIESLPESLRDQVCHCKSVNGYTKRADSNVWVCGNCHRPAPIVAAYNLLNECDFCEEPYLSYDFNDRNHICPDCKAVQDL